MGLSSHQEKIFKVDDHVNVAIAGLTTDDRVPSRYMQNECINYSSTYEPSFPIRRLVVQLADKAQAFAIGSQSQVAKTYLERRFENFIDSSRDNLVKDAPMAT